MNLPSRVSWSGIFFFFFFFFVVAKMTLKTGKFWKKSDLFWQKNLGKYLNLFSQIFSKHFKILVKKKGWFYKILEKTIQKISQNGKFRSVAPVKQFFLFFVFVFVLFCLFFFFCLWDYISKSVLKTTSKPNPVDWRSCPVPVGFYCSKQ